jgi:hypothetical protein
MQLSDDGIDATLATSRESVEALRWELLNATQTEPYRSVDPPKTFITVACTPIDQDRERLDDVGATYDNRTLRLQYRVVPEYGGTEIDKRFDYEIVKWESNGFTPDRVTVEQVPESSLDERK